LNIAPQISPQFTVGTGMAAADFAMGFVRDNSADMKDLRIPDSLYHQHEAKKQTWKRPKH
jgi:hypothetical protein